MAVLRQFNFLGQMRVDVPHLRSLESSIAADFDLMAGSIIAGGRTMVVRGFEVLNPQAAIGTAATSLQLSVANSIVMHPQASESGTILSVTPATPVETLSTTNARVQGGFTAGQVNYIGLDFARAADPSTSDLVSFINADTLQATARSVPLARTLQYTIVIGTTDFESTPDILPIAKVTTNALNVVTAIEDSRRMAFRLGTGGSVPNKQYAHTWTAGRNEKTQDAAGQIFSGGDKTLDSFKTWMDAVMSKLWELGGGEFWYSATTDRDLKVAYGAPTLGSNNDNFDWVLGTQTLSWSGLQVLFGASTGWYNLVQAGSAVLADGSCLYVDVNRATNGATIVPAVSTLTGLTQPAIPTSRLILAWRRGNFIYTRDRLYEVNRSAIAATTALVGVVRLNQTPGNALQPVVTSIMANGQVEVAATGGNSYAAKFTANGTGPGVVGLAGGQVAVPADYDGQGFVAYPSATTKDAFMAKQGWFSASATEGFRHRTAVTQKVFIPPERFGFSGSAEFSYTSDRYNSYPRIHVDSATSAGLDGDLKARIEVPPGATITGIEVFGNGQGNLAALKATVVRLAKSASGFAAGVYVNAAGSTGDAVTLDLPAWYSIPMAGGGHTVLPDNVYWLALRSPLVGSAITDSYNISGAWVTYTYTELRPGVI